MSVKVFVTGAAGFIGGHAVERLLAHGYEVTGIDNFDPFYDPAIKQRTVAGQLPHSAYRFAEVDIRDMDSLRECLPPDVDIILHLAAKAGVRPSIEDPLAYQSVNIQGTNNLLELARERGIPKFVFASSSSVYGVSPKVPWREDDPDLLPISPYAASKVSNELLARVYSHLFGIQAIGLRFFTVYGPRQRPDLAIHKFARRMLEGKSIPVFGDGSTRRDYTFIDDIIDGIVAAIDYQDSPYEIFNLGNNRTVSLSELIAGLEDALGVPALIDRLPEQPGDVPQTWASLEKSRAFLGYDPHTELADGLKAFAGWIRSEISEAELLPSISQPVDPTVVEKTA